MLDARAHHGLAHEARGDLDVSLERRVDRLERHALLEAQVLGEVDGAHSAFAELLEQLTPATDDRPAHGSAAGVPASTVASCPSVIEHDASSEHHPTAPAIGSAVHELRQKIRACSAPRH